ncbi:MAG: LCI fold-containing protein [Flavobacterium sp.]
MSVLLKDLSTSIPTGILLLETISCVRSSNGPFSNKFSLPVT